MNHLQWGAQFINLCGNGVLVINQPIFVIWHSVWLTASPWRKREIRKGSSWNVCIMQQLWIKYFEDQGCVEEAVLRNRGSGWGVGLLLSLECREDPATYLLQGTNVGPFFTARPYVRHFLADKFGSIISNIREMKYDLTAQLSKFRKNEILKYSYPNVEN